MIALDGRMALVTGGTIPLRRIPSAEQIVASHVTVLNVNGGSVLCG